MTHREFGTLSVRGSSLPTFEQCQRKFGADYIIDKKLDIGIELRSTKQNVGSVVGLSVHDGHSYLMSQLARTGSQGGDERAIHATERACSKLKELEQFGIGMDLTTPNLSDAARTVSRMMRRIHRKHCPDTEPLLVEQELTANFSYRDDGEAQKVILTGRPDTYLFGSILPDLKTGQRKPQAYAQMGIYYAMLQANNYPVSVIYLLWLQRVKVTARQPSGITIPIEPKQAKAQAFSVAKHANRGLRRLLTTGDPESLVANPSCTLCDPKYCAAFGTSFCRIGALVHPDKPLD